MQEWLKELIAAVGGGTIVLIGVLTIFKGLFVKLFETGIESSFEKNLEKFKNTLERSTYAYEILLNREMRFYEKLDPIMSELIPLVQDLSYYLQQYEGSDQTSQCENFKSSFHRYCELIIILKNEILIHQSYIPHEVFTVFSQTVKQMQNDLDNWESYAKLTFSGKYNEIDFKEVQYAVDVTLQQLAFAETKVQSRLKNLSGESN